VLLVPPLFLVVVAPRSALYTVGFILPLSYLAYRLSDAMPAAQCRIVYWCSVVTAATTHFTFGPESAAAWYISASIFLLGEPVVRDFLALFGMGRFRRL
jgi:hypothetical protein